MNIGLAISYFRSNYTSEVCQFLADACRQRGHRLFIFEGRQLENADKSYQTQNAIYRLINKKRLDGVICGSATMMKRVGRSGVYELCKMIDLPLVSLGAAFEGFTSVTTDNYSGMFDLMQHLLSHKYTRFAFLSGPTGNDEANAREQAFLDALAQSNISFSPENRLYGDFSAASGYSAAIKIIPAIKKGELDVVVCANDDAAFGLMNALHEHGIVIPNQVAVTGYDNSIPGRQYNPLMTTVSPNLKVAIEESLSLLEENILGRKSKSITISSEAIIRESCGCSNAKSRLINGLYNSMEAEYYKVYEHMQSFDLHQYLDDLNKCLIGRDIGNLFVVLFQEPITYNEYASFEFPKNAQIIYARVNNVRIENPNQLFETKLILPDELLDQCGSDALIVKPVFYVDELYGYTVAIPNVHNDGLLDDARFLLGQIVKTTHLFEERMQMEYRLKEALEELRGTNKRLSDLSLSDELTGLYNRRGFLKLAGEYFAHSNSQCLVVYADMDGLKYINDHYGHDEGDLALKAVSRILSECMRERDILSRQGGDEFLLLFKEADQSHAEMLSRRFTDKLMIANQILEKPYEVSFSWGIVCGSTADDLEALMRSADDLMLERKRLKKKRRDD